MVMLAASATKLIENVLITCSPGVKQNAKGYRTHWIGYKLHLDVADGDIPNLGAADLGQRARQPGGDLIGSPIRATTNNRSHSQSRCRQVI